MARYSQGVMLIWTVAASEAAVGSVPEIQPAHLLIGVCKLCDLDATARIGAGPGADEAARRELKGEVTAVRRLLGEAGADAVVFRRRLRAIIARPTHGARPPEGGVVHRSQAARQVFRQADELATGDLAASEASGEPLVRADHLLRAVLATPDPPWGALAHELGVAEGLARLAAGLSKPQPVLDRSAANAGTRPAGPPGAHGGLPTPFLDRFGRDLSAMARQGRLDPVIGRKQEIRTLARILTQQRKGNPIIVGEAGVGKTCIVEGLAERLAGPNPPSALVDKRIVEVSMASLVAGTKYRGEFEERMEALVGEVRGSEEVILFIDEIHTVLGAGGEGASDAANILKPALARGELRLIGATTIDEYRRHIERDPALERRFQLVWVDEPSPVEAGEILRGLRATLEHHHGLAITDEAIDAAVSLSARYLPDFRLPDKAIDLIDQACAAGRIATMTARDRLPASVTEIGQAEVAAVVAQRARVPVERLTQDQAARLLQMEEFLRTRVIGQDEALSAVSRALRTAGAGLADRHRPLGVFLFAGATGTGKTELAKALAEFLFDDEQRLIRVDMSEYMEKHAVSRLIGAPPGYLGHDEEGQLTGPVRTNPYSVVLFDEVEKAHPAVSDLFLQIFDDGRLTDARGRRASFTETVIVLTTNLGVGPPAGPPATRIGFGPAAAFAPGASVERAEYRDRIIAAIRSELRPELVNRLGHIVLFHPLSREAVRRITDKVLDGLRARLREHGVGVVLSDPAYDLLMEEGYDPAFGARQMERAVQRLIGDPLAEAILAGRVRAGTAVVVEVRDGTLVLSDADSTRPAPPYRRGTRR